MTPTTLTKSDDVDETNDIDDTNDMSEERCLPRRATTNSTKRRCWVMMMMPCASSFASVALRECIKSCEKSRVSSLTMSHLLTLLALKASSLSLSTFCANAMLSLPPARSLTALNEDARTLRIYWYH